MGSAVSAAVEEPGTGVTDHCLCAGHCCFLPKALKCCPKGSTGIMLELDSGLKLRVYVVNKTFLKSCLETSLVDQRLRLRLPTQGVQV